MILILLVIYVFASESILIVTNYPITWLLLAIFFDFHFSQTKNKQNQLTKNPLSPFFSLLLSLSPREISLIHGGCRDRWRINESLLTPTQTASPKAWKSIDFLNNSKWSSRTWYFHGSYQILGRDETCCYCLWSLITRYGIAKIRMRNCLSNWSNEFNLKIWKYRIF